MNNNFRPPTDCRIVISERILNALLEYMDILDVMDFLSQEELTYQDVANKLRECKEERAQRLQSPYTKRIVTDHLDDRGGKIYKLNA